MATGGVDLQMDDPSTQTITLRPEDNTDPSGDLSTYSFDDDGKSATYNTSETSHLIDGSEPFPGKGTELSGAPAGGTTHLKMFYVTNKDD